MQKDINPPTPQNQTNKHASNPTASTRDVAAGAVSVTDHRIVMLLKSMGAPETREGALVALDAVEKAIAAFSLACALPGAGAAADRLHDVLEQARHSWPAGALPRLRRGTRHFERRYDLWIRASENSGQSLSRAAWMLGIAACWLVVNNRPHPKWVVEALGRVDADAKALGAHWRSHASYGLEALEPGDAVALKQLASDASTRWQRDLAEWLYDAYATLQDDQMAIWARTDSPASDAPAASTVAKTSAFPRDADQQRAVPSERLTAAEQGSLVAWQYSRAARMGASLQAGLLSWDLLEPANLRRTLNRLIARVSQFDDLEKRFLLLALISLSTQLPAKKALQLGLRPSDDIWINPGAGEWTWSLIRIVGRRQCGPAQVAAGCQPSDSITLPLVPTCGVPYPPVRPEHIKTHDWLFPELPSDVLLSRFGHFLRDGTTEDPMKPYAARFAGSFGAAVLEATGDPVAAALGALDFRHLAPAEVNYLCISRSRVVDALRDTHDWLGLS